MSTRKSDAELRRRLVLLKERGVDLLGDLQRQRKVTVKDVLGIIIVDQG